MILTTGLACALLVGGFLLLVILRVPVAFALGIATIPVVMLEIRLTPLLLSTGCSSRITPLFYWLSHSFYWLPT